MKEIHNSIYILIANISYPNPNKLNINIYLRIYKLCAYEVYITLKDVRRKEKEHQAGL